MLASSGGSSSWAVGSPAAQQVVLASGHFHHRIALIIGINLYQDTANPQHSLQDLEHARQDAHGMLAQLVKHAGFSAQSVLVVDPTRDQLLESIYMFQSMVEKIRDASQTCFAVVYYAGHGMMSASREQYLLPRNYKRLNGLLDSDTASLEMYGVKLEGPVLGSISQATAALVLIDACRSMAQPPRQSSVSPPRASSPQHHQLSYIANKENLLLCYACAEGSVAYDCAFAAALFKVFFDNPDRLTLFNAMLKVRECVLKSTEHLEQQQIPDIVVQCKSGLFDFQLVPESATAKQQSADRRMRHHCEPVAPVQKPLGKIQDPEIPPWDRIAAAWLLLKQTSPAMPDSTSWVQSIVDCGGLEWLQKVVSDENKTAGPELRCHVCGILQNAAAAGYTQELLDAGVPAALLCAFMEGGDLKLSNAAFDALQDMLQTQVVCEWLAQKDTLERLVDNIAEAVQLLSERLAMMECDTSAIESTIHSFQLLQHLLQHRSRHLSVQKSLQDKRDVLREITSNISGTLGPQLQKHKVGLELLHMSAIVRMLANLSA